jgi:rhamnogalacturonan hydrolase
MKLFTLVNAFLATRAYAQLIAPVGPTTSLSKKINECNVLDYGAVSDNSSDTADAIEKAFQSCVLHKPGSRLVIPEGDYLVTRSVILSNGTNWAFQLDGLITLAYGGNWTVDRELILQGYAGAEPLNATINGEGDGLFLQNGITIINGWYCLPHVDMKLILLTHKAVDFEFYSQNGKGAIQGQGYIYRNLAKYVFNMKQDEDLHILAHFALGLCV